MMTESCGILYHPFYIFFSFMLTLFLDFGSHQSTIALVDNDKTLAMKTFETRPKESDILKTIEAMAPLQNLNRIAVITGPGGFMTLRTGFSIANALAWSLKIPVGGITLYDLWSARISSTEQLSPTNSFLWLHSTKKDLLFIQGIGTLKAAFPEVKAITLSEAQKQITSNMTWIGELIPEHHEALAAKAAKNLSTVESILPHLLQNIAYSSPPVLPWYGRGI
jgi:hypothetical protein